jgi:predicted nucleic acid-binding protein
MIDRVFLDTNVLVYLYDADAPEKQQRARSVLEGGLPAFVISTQVLQEFYVSVTRKFAKSMAEEDISRAMRRLRELPTVQVDVPMIFEAVELGRRFQIAFWDALIARAALSADCSRLLTEDLQHQMRIGNLTVENPFLIL